MKKTAEEVKLDLEEILGWKAEKIQKFVNGLLPREREIWIKILQELAVGDTSPTYEDLWKADYREIIPDWDTFIDDSRYLGNATNNGKGVYDAWREYGRQVLTPGSGIVECILTGATRIGKSTCGCLIGAYELMRLMCMKKPQLLFGLLPDSIITFLFFNITKDLAKDVTFRQFNDMLTSSPWFNSHGTWSQSEESPVYRPGFNHIKVKAGSASVGGRHGLGQQVFFACLVADTEIRTDQGIKRIEDVVGQTINVLQYNEETGEEYYVSAPVLQTGVTRETVKITLENGSIIEGTPNHRVMLQDGTYKELQDLTEVDELMLIEKPDTSWLVYVQGGRKMGIQEIKHVFYPEPIPVYDVCNAVPRHNFVVHSNGVGIVSSNCMDEVNFETGAVKDVRAAKTKMMDCYGTLYTRVTGTFSLNGECWGKMVALSSKKDTCDFIEAYVENKEKNGATDFLKFDKPQWEVLPPKRFWKEQDDGSYNTQDRCCVAVATRTLPGLVVPKADDTPEMRDSLISQGYELIYPPESLRKTFEMDYDTALIDQAGISRVGVRTFISAQLLERNYTDRRNAFSLPIIDIGTKDDYKLEEWFDISVIPLEERSKPLGIHLDLSINRDKTGIAGTARTGVMEIIDTKIEDGKEVTKIHTAPMHKQWFGTSLRAPTGAHIPYEKIRQFLLWLRDEKHFNIKVITTDGFESEYMHQLLQADGFNTEKRSLDRTQTGYARLRDALVDKTFEPLRIPLLDKELCELYWTGRKWDHPHSGCFTGDTLIASPSGQVKSLEQLVKEFQEGKVNWVYSFDHSIQKIRPFVITNAFETKRVTQLVEVTLDNGEKVRCTPDHRFMLRDGSYKEAQHLGIQESLMPLYTKFRHDKSSEMYRYRLFYEPMEDLWHYEHRKFASEYVIPRGNVVHHKNHDKEDNTPDNLQIMENSEHTKLHNAKQSDETRRKRSESIKRWHEENRNTEAYKARAEKCRVGTLRNARKQGLTPVSENKATRIKAIEEMFGVVWNDLTLGEKNSYSGKYARNIDPTIQERTSATLSQRHKEGYFINAYAALKACNARGGYAPGGKHDGLKNHKVVSVTLIEVEETPVYDLTVDGSHNFALAAGVFVHNSKDLSDGCAGSHWSISEMDFEDDQSIVNTLTAGYKRYANKSVGVGKSVTQDFFPDLVDSKRGIRPKVWI